MDKLPLSAVYKIAEENFPNAPEALVSILGIEVEYVPICCDGWCLQRGSHASITINSSVAEVRRRFTLAHELGHLILDIPSVVGESSTNIQKSLSAAEKNVNEFAGNILLPVDFAKEAITDIPVTASMIRDLAKRANVSQVFVARRLAAIAPHIGLKDAITVFYQGGELKWQWSETLEIVPDSGNELLKDCLHAHPAILRHYRQDKNDVLVAFILKNSQNDSSTIFLQSVTEEQGRQKTAEERSRELLDFIIGDTGVTRPSLEGCFSHVKTGATGMSLNEAVAYFNDRYLNRTDRWPQNFLDNLASPSGQEYIRLRLSKWARD